MFEEYLWLAWVVLAGSLWALSYPLTWPRKDDRWLPLDQAIDYYSEHAHRWSYLRRLLFGIQLTLGWLLALILRRRY